MTTLAQAIDQTRSSDETAVSMTVHQPQRTDALAADVGFARLGGYEERA